MIARPTPVLPEVGSTITPPLRSLPSRSAVSTIRSAMRSFIEPPGFRYSIFARTSLVRAMPFVTDFSRSRGVFPIASVSESYASTRFPSHLPGGQPPVPPMKQRTAS